MSLKITTSINENQKYLSREELLERVLYFRKDKENEFIYFVSDTDLFRELPKEFSITLTN